MLDNAKSFATEDMVYLELDDGREMDLRLFRPEGEGPHPLVIDIHGGAWNKSDLNGCTARDEALAATGLACAALNFRHAADGYPSSLQDINYATRWLKAKSGELGLDAGRVGYSGQSSGGHLAMLAAMKPEDTRYAAIPLPDGLAETDARVRCVAMAWPVINPLSRYRHALRCLETGENAGWVGDIPDSHHTYWGTEEVMEEGNPMLILERGENVELPPAIWIQGRPDIVHDYRDLSTDASKNEPERFADNYRAAGGVCEIIDVAQDRRGTEDSWNPMAEFFHKFLG